MFPLHQNEIDRERERDTEREREREREGGEERKNAEPEMKMNLRWTGIDRGNLPAER
jgi:hypothetical protein